MTSRDSQQSNIPAFSPDELARIVADTFVARVDYHTELESTNNTALKLVRDLPEIPVATLVLTEHQTAGRGRGENRWWSGEGGLTFSLLINCDALQIPPSRWPIISLTTGLAVCDAIDRELGDVKPRLKWPNDVYLRGCKVCGILVEVPDSRHARVVIGIGINVNNSAEHAPLELRGFAISLSDLAQRTLGPTDILISILQSLAGRLENLATGCLDLRKDWQKRCLLTGQTIQVEQDKRQLSGLCHGIDEDGALALETDLGLERCLSGTVTHFSKD
ncbi:biotin--[acetyl-CoA-carboxylase] ligase [Bythopirellula polymerisocia]|uniref:biotin--[biotin carboxyl-carrier protein] ligase n=1 Tax=Bythopirellula polymerisocia TaxID=2528003 RepID=A0A5C6CLU4_9BACT|nr:biotin--[acetyl-CoA-carboxylase] ligase [Bythopirellula polymerisocia]TWU24527.1 Bifunctional ligase/repressor BirA [Bythopirellula polymerisocia]